jgi:hypothetical protein
MGNVLSKMVTSFHHREPHHELDMAQFSTPSEAELDRRKVSF